MTAYGVYFFMLCPLGKATKDNKIQFQISENPQFSARLDPRVRRDIGRVPKNKAIKPGSSYRSILPQTIPFLDALASLESMLESD